MNDDIKAWGKEAKSMLQLELDNIAIEKAKREIEAFLDSERGAKARSEFEAKPKHWIAKHWTKHNEAKQRAADAKAAKIAKRKEQAAAKAEAQREAKQTAIAQHLAKVRDRALKQRERYEQIQCGQAMQAREEDN